MKNTAPIRGSGYFFAKKRLPRGQSPITMTERGTQQQGHNNKRDCRTIGARAKRVEAGYSYGGVAADFDHSACTSHHMELIEFDQIFGGAQYAVKGLKSYDGVTVIYNNK